jgi:multisubunit Na+/H+ antiporter MnhE subunit
MILPGIRPRRLVGLAAGLAALYGLWLLLVENFDGAELLAGAAAALVGIVAADLAADHDLGLRAGPEVLRGSWRLVPRMVSDSLLVLAVSLLAGVRLRRLRSGFRTIPFDVGNGQDPADCGRRALMTARQSFTPNTCVVGFDDEEGAMVVHQLVPTIPRQRRGRSRGG